MKRIICLILLLSMCLSLTACGDGESHIGEAKTPSGSSAMQGRDYQDVIDNFKEKGFTNIRTEKIEDLIAGWLTKDGEVEEVSVGGDVDYSPDKWLPVDTEVLIKYHTFPSNEEDSSWTEKDDSSKQPTEETADERNEDKQSTGEVPVEAKENLTIENCEELAALIHMDYEKDESSIQSFANNYKGREIEIELLTAFVEPYKNYNTRFNYTLYAVDGDKAMLSGPVFSFKDVNYYDLHLTGPNKPDSFVSGLHCLVCAKVEGYEDGFVLLDPVSIEVIKAY